MFSVDKRRLAMHHDAVRKSRSEGVEWIVRSEVFYRLIINSVLPHMWIYIRHRLSVPERACLGIL